MDGEYGQDMGMPEENKSDDNNMTGEETQQNEIRTEEAAAQAEPITEGTVTEMEAVPEVETFTEVEAVPEVETFTEVEAVPEVETASQYSDPNAGVKPQYEMPYQNTGGYQNQQGQTNEQGQQAQTNNYSYGNGGQNSTPNYNQNSNPGYNKSPNYSAEDETRVMSMGDWLLTLLAFMIPCAGIILYFVWAFSNGGNKNRKNFCRAYLIIAGIAMVIGIILWTIIFVTVGSSMRYYY